VLLTPHYDILDWIKPDWIFDTKTKIFERGLPRQRPKIELKIFKVDQSYWKFYKQHYYLNLPMPPCAEYFIGTVDGELTCHVAVAPMFTAHGYRATRLVTMPEWQGAGVGMKFLEWIAQYHLDGNGRCNKKLGTFFHTSHPQLCQALRRSKKWIQTSAILYGGNKTRSAGTMQRSRKKQKKKESCNSGYGGHFRAVQGFKYIGEDQA